MTGQPSRASDGRIVGRACADSNAALLDVNEVASLLSCSARHVYRLADAGRMPQPVKLGQLVRWRRAALSDWLDAGCPAMRRAGGGREMNGRDARESISTTTGDRETIAALGHGDVVEAQRNWGKRQRAEAAA